MPGDSYPRVLFRNPGNASAWINIRLRGTKTNRFGQGARVTVVAAGADGTRRSIPRVVSSGGSFGSSPLTLHVGLGNATAVDRIEIYWPVSKTVQTITRPPVRRTIEIREGAATWNAVATTP